MACTLACIAEQWDCEAFPSRSVGCRDTPFGPSGELFLLDPLDPLDPPDISDTSEAASPRCYLLSREPGDKTDVTRHRVNDRANLYALKDLGVTCVVGWGPGAAVTHNIAVGDLVVLSDVIDQTTQREGSFFPNSPLGRLRQFPVFCEFLRHRLVETLKASNQPHRISGIAAVREGPRWETPAEVRMLTQIGAELITSAFVPEMFLARELQMGYVAVCHVTNYAETGSRFEPFRAAAPQLFSVRETAEHAPLPPDSRAVLAQTILRLAVHLAEAESAKGRDCYCRETQADHIREFSLSEDWHDWITTG